MNRRQILAACCLAALGAGGCKTVYKTPRTPQTELAAEPSLGFLRPDRYSILGTRSVRDYIEVTYERQETTPASMAEVQIGLRNRGGQHWWDTRGPNVTLMVKATFYADPVGLSGPTGPPVYETNWQTVRIMRGDTVHQKFTCPVPEGKHYQVRLTDTVKGR